MEQTAFLVRRHRHDYSHDGWEHRLRPNDLVIGERVCITSGPLAGLRGSLTAQGQDGKWVLEVTDAGRGVLVCIGEHQLNRI